MRSSGRTTVSRTMARMPSVRRRRRGRRVRLARVVETLETASVVVVRVLVVIVDISVVVSARADVRAEAAAAGAVGAVGTEVFGTNGTAVEPGDVIRGATADATSLEGRGHEREISRGAGC